MLRSLYISSFVIIDEVKVEFHDGMNVLTGETGAGKSILIDALGQLCGQRASSSLVRKNCQKAIIEGVFDVEMTPAFESVCEQLHLEIDDEIVITKEILESGKSSIKINYQTASNAALKLLSPYLLDIHSQFETQKLFEEKNHIALLDAYGNQELHEFIQNYHELYQTYKEKTKHLTEVKNEDLSDEQLEFLESQAEEIDEITYTDEEVDDLENELKTMQNYEKMNENIQNFHQIMNASQGALPLMKEALSYLDNVSYIDDFKDYYDSLYNEYYNILDTYENVMDIYQGFHFDEYRFEELQETIFKINRLKRKYGLTMERIQEERENIQSQIDRIHHRDEYISKIELEISKMEKELNHFAQKIHTLREKYALQFEKEIHKELKDLYLDKAVFKINFENTDFQSNGKDKVRFMVAMNQGQELSLLNESASGGEISRLMLAIKTIILRYQNMDTIIFDEVDTGVSGKVASSIGEKMKNLAKNKQVICITHLPQVASFAQYHYCIEKQSSDNITVSSIHLLQEKERVVEIAKMLSGENVTPQAIENAKILLNV